MLCVIVLLCVVFCDALRCVRVLCCVVLVCLCWVWYVGYGLFWSVLCCCAGLCEFVLVCCVASCVCGGWVCLGVGLVLALVC